MKNSGEKTVLYIRDAPVSLARKLRAAAALAGYRGIPDYVIKVLTNHTEELERTGALPSRAKGGLPKTK